MRFRNFLRNYAKVNETSFYSNMKEKFHINQQQQQQQQSEKSQSHYIKPIDLNAGISDVISEKYSKFPFAVRHNAITDDYEVSRESLGIGINGKVLTCWHRDSRRKCALKIIKDSDKARRELILHKKACEGCDNIVQILDIYENIFGEHRCLLLVMECMEGGELFNRIRNRHDKPFTEREAAQIILMITKAVAHLHHMDIAHRDLKPENLLFTTNSSDALLKLTDFGFAKEGNNEQRPLNTPCYTPYYVAPEILSNDKYDKACDIWSLGVIMYILLCGYPPFFSAHGGPISAGMQTKIKAGEYQFPKDEWQNISHEAISVIQKMLTVDPVLRVNIDWILQCSWLVGTVPETPINIHSMFDPDNYEQMQIEIAVANHAQRRAEDDEHIGILRPDKSRIAQRAAKRQRQSTAENVTPPL